MTVGPGSIHAGFRFLAWLFPAAPLEKVTPLSVDELKAQYRQRDRWLNFLGFLGFLVVAVAYFFLLDFAAEWYYRDLTGSGPLLRLERAVIGVLAAFLSLCSSTLLLLLILRGGLGRQEYATYIAYASHKAYPPAPFDVTRSFQLIFWLGFFPLAALTFLLIDNDTAFTDQAIIENPFWSIGAHTEHPYSAVRGLYEVQGYHARFEDKIAPFQVIVFADGTRWESPHGTGGSKLEHQREIMRFVAARTRLDVRKVSFIENIPP